MKHLAPLLAVAFLTAAAPARADDVDKEKEKAAAAESADKAAEVGSHYPPPSTRIKLIAAGAIVTASAWGLSFALAQAWPERPCVITNAGAVYPGSNPLHPTYCTSGPPGSTQFAYPVVGPWIALAKSGCAVDEPTCSIAKPILRGVGYVVDGVVQAAGIGLMIQALVMKTESAETPNKDTKRSALTVRFRGIEATAMPSVSPTMSGMSVVGTF
jgi:hypothetical protein